MLVRETAVRVLGTGGSSVDVRETAARVLA